MLELESGGAPAASRRRAAIPRPRRRQRAEAPHRDIASRIELYELTLPLLEPFIISGGTMTERRSLVVVLQDDEGHRGYGESPPFELPVLLRGDARLGARLLLERVLIPRLIEGEVESRRRSTRSSSTGSEAIRSPARRWRPRPGTSRPPAAGSGSPTLLAERLGVEPAPAHSLRGGARHSRRIARPIPSGAGSTRRSPQGYRRVKIKVAPGWDAAPVDAAHDVARGHRAAADRGCQRRLRVARARGEPPRRSTRAESALHRAAARARRAGRPRAARARSCRPRSAWTRPCGTPRAARQIVELGGPGSGTSRCTGWAGCPRSAGSPDRPRRRCAASGPARCPSRASAPRPPSPRPRCRGSSIPSDLEPSARWFPADTDVIELRMAADGTMEVPGTSIAGRLDEDRFRRASRRLH